MREKKTIPQPTNPVIPMNTITDYLNLPFIEVLKRLMKDAVKDCLAESGVLATFANASAKTKKRDPEGLAATEALEFLNENGYPMKKGQLYKETSKGTIPYKKFNNKLHFKEAELLAWAESRLIDGKAVGVLTADDRPKRKGGSR